MPNSNELLKHPGLFHAPEVRAGLIELSEETRIAFLGDRYHKPEDLQVYRAPTHRLPGVEVGVASDAFLLAPAEYIAYGTIPQDAVFIAYDERRTPTFYKANREFTYGLERSAYATLTPGADWLISSGIARKCAAVLDINAFYEQPEYRRSERTFLEHGKTPGYRWTDDPFSGYYDDSSRSKLAKGDATDYELANAIYMMPGSDIGLQTAVKERIRWLSRQLSMLTGNIEGTTRKSVVMISRSALALMLSSLRRDAENGLLARGDIVETVEKDIEDLNK